MAQEFFHIPGATNDPGYGNAAKAFSVNYLQALWDKQGAFKRLRSFDADVAAFGESVTVPSFPRITAADASFTDGTYTPDNSSVTPQTILINKCKVVSHVVPEPVFYQSKMDMKSAFATESGRSVGDSIDAEVVKLIPSLTKTAGTAGSDIDETIALAALQSLVTYHCDLTATNDFVWILPASQFAAVHKLKGYESFRLYAGNSNAEGTGDVRAALDTLYGFPVHFRSDSAMTVSTGKLGGLFYRDSVGVAIQRMPSMRAPLPVARSINLELSCWALYGIAVIKDECAVKILCK